MKRLSIFLSSLLVTVCLQGQFFQVDQYGQSLFESGSKLIKMGDYKAADSLLTEALCSYKNENVYYNRAVARLLLKDTIGFCGDMNIAAYRYFDDAAARTFGNMCCKNVDTLYFDKKMNVTSGSKYRYYEIINEYKYSELTMGSFHDIKSQDVLYSADYGCESDLLGIATKSTDIIAIYQIEDGKKYYFKTKKPISIYNESSYDHLQKRATKFLNQKYGFVKKESETENIKVYFEMFVSKSGEIEKVTFIGLFPEIKTEDICSELEKDILKLVSNYPKITPAKFKGEKVNYRAYDFMEF